jgi:ABC-type Fe3+/spermidine/putrescine transport system ATPase subunit
LADTLYFIENGRCLQAGKKEDVVAKPASLEVVRLLGLYMTAAAEITYLDPARDIGRVRIAGQVIETRYLPGHLLGDRGWICVRRSDIHVLPYSQEPNTNQIVVEWQSRSTTVRGVKLEFDNGLSAEMNEARFRELDGSRKVRLEFQKESVHFLTEN